MNKKIVSLAIAATMSLALFAGCSQTPADNADPSASPSSAPTQASGNKLIMGTNAEFEPFEYREGGEIVGFDVDMAKEIAKDQAKELQIEDMNFDSLIAALTTGKIDMAVAGMTITDERKKEADFSDPYYSATQVIIVLKDGATVKSAADLAGKKIGVQEGTTGDLYVSDQENVPDAEVSRFKKGIDAALDLANGRVDAVVIDEKPAMKIVESNDKLMILDEALTKEEYAIAVKKGNTELVNAINKTLARIKEDGTYLEIMKKFLPNDVAALEEANAQ